MKGEHAGARMSHHLGVESIFPFKASMMIHWANSSPRYPGRRSSSLALHSSSSASIPSIGMPRCWAAARTRCATTRRKKAAAPGASRSSTTCFISTMSGPSRVSQIGRMKMGYFWCVCHLWRQAIHRKYRPTPRIITALTFSTTSDQRPNDRSRLITPVKVPASTIGTPRPSA